MKGPPRTRAEIRFYLQREVVALGNQAGIDREASIRVVAAKIGSTPEKVSAVLSGKWAA